MLCSGSGIAAGLACDISSSDQIEAAVEKVVSAYGGIHILVNNAFISSAPSLSVLGLSAEQLRRNFDTGPIAYSPR